MPGKHLILVVEDSEGWRDLICETLEEQGYKVISTNTVEKAKQVLRSHQVSLATVDLNYSMSLDPAEKGSQIDRGSNLLTYIKDHYPELPCLVITSSKKTVTEVAEFLFKFGNVVKGFLDKNDPSIAEKIPEKIKTILAASTPSGDKPRPEFKPEIVADKEIFISYAWGGESEIVVDQLDQALQKKGVVVIRDKRNLGFKGRIKDFMKQIGRGKAVIVVISEKYLTSENCMFELVQIAKNGQFYDRIFPIVLADANIYKPIHRLRYIKYWEDQIAQLDAAIKDVGAAHLQGIREDIDSYTEIRAMIAELVNILKDMNTLTPEMHRESGFNELLEAIERRMAE